MKDSFIAGAVAAGFTASQAEFLWTAIPFHPLTEEWKRPTFRENPDIARYKNTVDGLRIACGRLWP